MRMHSNYLDCILCPASLKTLVAAATKKLRKVNFDAIAFRGMSGTIFAAPLAMQLKKQLLLVRKKDGSHSDYDVEGDYDIINYIIVDDFVSTGKTIKCIRDKVKKNISGSKLVGLYLYGPMSSTSSMRDTIKRMGFTLLSKGE